MWLCPSAPWQRGRAFDLENPCRAGIDTLLGIKNFWGSGMDSSAAFKSHTARTFEALRDSIVRGDYLPGEKLRIDHMSKAFEASSGAVREALSRLTAEGLVRALPQKGFIVTPVSRRDLKDLTDVRVEIECRCLADSIDKADAEWEGRILSLKHQLRRLEAAVAKPTTPENARWHQLHKQFHSELTAGCANTWWLKLREQLYFQSERYRRLSGPVDESNRDISAEHDAIAEAAVMRDKKKAVAALADHLRKTTDILLNSRIPFSDE
jgi:DNA-binding GntR family transcriptional regulator